MPEFNYNEAKEKFYHGKSLLDGDAYTQAIKSYDVFIAIYQQFLEIPEAKAMVENALNNRGVAKCKSGLRNKNKTLYRDGMKDYEQSVAMEGEITEQEKEGLNAQRNLLFAENEVKDFENKTATTGTDWYITN